MIKFGVIYAIFSADIDENLDWDFPNFGISVLNPLCA